MTSAIQTAFTQLTGCTVPIQLAAMGGDVVTVDLATEVCRAGGFGMLNRYGAVPLAERLDLMEQAGVSTFGVNFTLHNAYERVSRDEVEQAASRARLVEFFWADPNPEWVGWVKAAGCLAGWQVGSVDEAKAAVDAGCDVVVVQGTEAGGHVRGTVALLPLLGEVLDQVDVPVLAAGGIATARTMAAVLAAGASGVRIGTRFLATRESGAHPDYVAALLEADGQGTMLTDLFSVGWPDAPHRVLVSAAEAATRVTGDVVGMLGDQPIPRLGAQTPNRDTTGTVTAMALYAGQGVGAVHSVVPAGRVVSDLAQGARALLARWTGE